VAAVSSNWAPRPAEQYIVEPLNIVLLWSRKRKSTQSMTPMDTAEAGTRILISFNKNSSTRQPHAFSSTFSALAFFFFYIFEHYFDNTVHAISFSSGRSVGGVVLAAPLFFVYSSSTLLTEQSAESNDVNTTQRLPLNFPILVNCL
jgi:hypothetical protein